MTTRLMHFSDKPLYSVLSKVQDPTAMMKPRGLWVSVEGRGDGWSDYCRSDYVGGMGAVAHEVTLWRHANILRLKNSSDIDAFTEEYCEVPDRLFVGSDPQLRQLLERMSVAWYRLAQKFSGILIDPYIYERRLTPHSQWYYGWDCASGCIWDSAAVESIQVVQWTATPRVEA